MTAASLGPAPSLFTFLSRKDTDSYRQWETFVFSLLGQTAILALIIYLTSVAIGPPTDLARRFPIPRDLPLIFSGKNGGGGGNFELLPASRGNPPRASLDPQIVPPTVVVPNEMPKLPTEETVVVAPEIKFPQGAPIGDPSSLFSNPSDGRGGPGGIGDGCCGELETTRDHILVPGRRGFIPPGKWV